MRIAVVSDIHGNLTAFEAVLEDLRETAPDLIFHGGDLAHAGSSPSEIVDRIRDLKWSGVLGNTDEMLFRPESLTEFGLPEPLSSAIAKMAAWTVESLGEERLNWLSELPWRQIHAPMALVHASPKDLWRAPMPDASEEKFEVYAELGQPVAVYAHIHRSHVRVVSGRTIVNTGSVSLSHDGDPRAAYLLLDDGAPSVRRVPYDMEKAVTLLKSSGLPRADWVARMLAAARPEAQ
ncbi:MAG TPA: metallophosphoesterase family protein [Bryobacteraceae bacterium]|nr:metallophosphoesterase family protein [Bryobacteraceae bacterium]